MARAHHVAHTHQPFVAPREALVNLPEPLLIEIERHLIVGIRSLKRHVPIHDKLILNDIAKHHVGILQHAAQRLARISPVFPEVLAVIDIKRYRLAHLVGNVERLKRSITRILRDSPRDARSMKHVGILQNLTPVQHPRLQLIESRIGTVIDHLRRAHTCRLLIIVSAHTVAAPNRIGHTDAVFQQFHTRSLPNLVSGQSRHILHVVTHLGQRHGNIGLATSVSPRERLTLRQSHAVGFGEAQQQFAECYYLLVHTCAAKVKTFLLICKLYIKKTEKKRTRFTEFSYLCIQ